MKPEWFRKGIMGDRPNPTNLETTHALLGKIAPSPSTSYSTENLDKTVVQTPRRILEPKRRSENYDSRLGFAAYEHERR